jgi:RNA polymerase sigma-70 factor (ECF subfamily)
MAGEFLVHPRRTPAERPSERRTALAGTGAAAGAREHEALRFEDVYREHFAFAWRTVRRMSVRAGSVDDVVQDAFVVVHRRLGDYDPRMSLRGWLYGILVRVVADHRRRARRKDSRCTSIDDDERGTERFASTAPPPSEGVEHGEALALLERILEDLSPEHREVLVLSRLEEMNVPEIAQAIGANVNTVYSRLRAASERFDALYTRLRAGEEPAGR